MKNYKYLFNNLFEHRMLQADTMQALALSQKDFLRMLSDGVSAIKGENLTHAEFARVVGVSPKSMYAYYSSPDAKDYRNLSDDARIAMIWRVINIAQPQPKKENRPHKNKYYIINGEKVSREQAARLLDYSHATALGAKLKKLGIKHGADISNLVNDRNSATKPQIYVVNGKKMSTNQAAKVLGFGTQCGLRYWLKKKQIPEGADITFLQRSSPFQDGEQS